MNTYEFCPYCDSPRVLVKYIIDNRFILNCRDCGLMRLYPFPTESDLEQVYDKDYYSNPLFFSGDCLNVYGYSDIFEEKGRKQSGYVRILEEIERFRVIDNTRLLDVGCGPGFFLESALDYGHNPSGLEFNPFAQAYVEKSLSLECHDCCLTKYTTDEQYGVITMFDVVEHLMDPFQAVKKVSELLADKGLFVLSTMDCGSLTSRLLGERNEDIQRVSEHLFFFDKSFLFNFLENNGFEIVHHRYIGHMFKFPDLVKRIGQLFPTTRSLCDFIVSKEIFVDKEVYLNPYTKILIFARKC